MLYADTKICHGAFGELTLIKLAKKMIPMEEFSFRGQQFKVGDPVRVSQHYAGYKNQYAFMVGVVFINSIDNMPWVRIAINPSDIEQGNEQQLEVWKLVEKI